MPFLLDYLCFLVYNSSMDIKKNVAQNLVKYRKALNITQAELAEKINYSDKAVSKWERAESIPDIYILKLIANLFGISVDTLISPPKEDNPSIIKQISRKKTINALIIIGVVWLIAIASYTLLDILSPAIKDYWKTWLAFIYAIPISLFILLVLMSVMGKNLTNMIVSSLFLWTLILSFYLTLLTSLPSPSEKLWEIFLVGIPLQAIDVFFYCYKKNSKNTKQKSVKNSKK